MAKINLSAKFQIFSRSAGGIADYNIIGFFNDEMSLYASTDVEVNDRVIDLAGNIYRIAAINSDASIMNLDVEDIEGNGLPNIGGGLIFKPTGCVPINLPASGIANDLNNIVTHDRIISLTEFVCEDDFCQYSANISELTGATFEGITINDTFFAYTGSTITLNTPEAENSILDHLNGLGLGIFEINNFTIGISGTTYTISSSNINTVNSIRHNDGSDNDTDFSNSCDSIGGGGGGELTYIYNSNEALIKSIGTGVTYNTGTFLIPEDVTLDYLRINGDINDLNENNEFVITITHQGNTGNGYSSINDNLDGFYPPTINIIDRSIDDFGTPPAANTTTPYVYNTGAISRAREIINVGSKTLEFRILNMDAFLEWSIVLHF